MKVWHLLRTGYGLLNKWSGPLMLSFVLVMLRIVWGWQFFEAGWGKLNNIERTTEFFASLSIPVPGANAWLVGITECVGGLLLLVGLLSRPVALALFINMAVAYLTAHMDGLKALFVSGDAWTFGEQAPFWFLLTAGIVFAFGPGWFSADAALTPLLARTDRKFVFTEGT